MIKTILFIFVGIFFVGCVSNVSTLKNETLSEKDKIFYLKPTNIQNNVVSNYKVVNDNLILVSADKKNIIVKNVSNPNNYKIFSGYINEGVLGNVFDVTLDTQKKYLVSSGIFSTHNGKSGNIRIYNYNTEKIINTISTSVDPVNYVQFSKNNLYLVSATQNSVSIWKNQSFENLKTISFDTSILSAQVFENENKQFCVLSTAESEIVLINLDTQEIEKQVKIFDRPEKIVISNNKIFVLGNFPNSSLTIIDFDMRIDSYNLITKKDKHFKLTDKSDIFKYKKNWATTVAISSFEKSYQINDISNIDENLYLIVNGSDILFLESDLQKLSVVKNNNSYIKNIRGNQKNIYLQNQNDEIFSINEPNLVNSHNFMLEQIKKILNLQLKPLSNQDNSIEILHSLNPGYLLSNETNNEIIDKYKKALLSNATKGNINSDIETDNEIFIYDNFKLENSIVTEKFSQYGFLNGNILVALKSGLIELYDLNGKKLKTLNFNSQQIKSLYSDGKYLITIDTNNLIKMIDIEKNSLIVSLVIDHNNYVLWTEEGYFTVSSIQALDYVAWHMNQNMNQEAKLFNVEKFYDVFFRPDLVKLKLKGIDINSYTNGLTANDALQNPPPEVVINNESELKRTDKKNIKVSFTVNNIGGGIGTIRVYQEGKLIKTIGDSKINKVIANVDTKIEEQEKEKKLSEYQQLALSKAINGKNLKIDEQITNSFDKELIVNNPGDYEIDVPLKNGLNQISIEAFNKTNTITSFRSIVNINANIPEKKPKLYAIVAGVNNFESNYGNSLQDLKYAVNDAKSISDIALEAKEKIFDDVEIIYLTDNQVTKENIEQAFEKISKKASLEDTILFYISTHGISANSKFYLLPSNNAQLTNLIEFNEIFKKSSELKSLNQIFMIDACQSGSANDIASAVYDSRASVLARSSGIHLLSASTSGTYAFENNEYKHSNFTYQILNAIKNNELDRNKDGFISIIELSNKLKSLDSKEKQFPVIQNIGNDIKLNKLY
ncbi:hypothetical protein [Aliarcobacter butzleri]|uniref:hypothetical protein n=1 Tax=Aliarcobacter butzleri TaxID=28197 RepID=UPI002B250561|nr:hypothetical protein [Aliarcobacter butzleri]